MSSLANVQDLAPDDLGFGLLPEGLRAAHLTAMVSDLELAIGESLSVGLGDDELEEFSQIIDGEPVAVADFLDAHRPDWRDTRDFTDPADAAAGLWLSVHRPAYREVVADEFDMLRLRVRAFPERELARTLFTEERLSATGAGAELAPTHQRALTLEIRSRLIATVNETITAGLDARHRAELIALRQDADSALAVVGAQPRGVRTTAQNARGGHHRTGMTALDQFYAGQVPDRGRIVAEVVVNLAALLGVDGRR